jgi:hypothetical protein
LEIQNTSNSTLADLLFDSISSFALIVGKNSKLFDIDRMAQWNVEVPVLLHYSDYWYPQEVTEYFCNRSIL